MSATRRAGKCRGLMPLWCDTWLVGSSRPRSTWNSHCGPSRVRPVHHVSVLIGTMIHSLFVLSSYPDVILVYDCQKMQACLSQFARRFLRTKKSMSPLIPFFCWTCHKDMYDRHSSSGSTGLKASTRDTCVIIMVEDQPCLV